MGTTASHIIKQAQSYVGTKEGSENHKSIINTYNSHKPLARGYKVKMSDNWCATFISFLAIKCGATNIIPLECSCGRMIELLKKKSIWEENDNITPKPGYIIMYDWDKKDGWPDHVGIVEKVSGNTITVIEGNKSDSVSRRTISVGDSSIRGYGKPKYNAESKPKPSGNAKVKELQKALNADLKTNLDVDGIIGPKTKAAMNKVVIKKTLIECEEKQKYNLYGELITANIYNIKKGDKEVEALNYYSEEEEYI
ncbi:MAG: CHAP domain-containing protein, partial [Coprobacillus sp.]